MWASLVVILYALFASVFTIGKWGLEYSQPLFLVGSRMAFAGLLMLGYLFFFRRNELFIKREHIWRLLGLAACNIYLCNILEFWGLKYLPSCKTCFLYSLSPFLSAIFAYFLIAERMSPKKMLGLAIGFIGFFPILLQQTEGQEQLGQLFFLSAAEFAVLGAVVCSVYGWILLKQLCDENQYSPLVANGWSMLIGGVMALTHSAFVEDWNPFPVTNYNVFFASAIALTIISNMICYNLYGILLRRYTATFMSLAGFTVPLFTALFGWFFLDETISWHFYVSFVVVFFGLMIFHRDEMKQQVVVSQN